MTTRYAALDVGDRKVGIATGDSEFRIAFPQPHFVRAGDDDSDIPRLVAALLEHGAEQLIVGLPLTSDGEPTTQAGKVHGFVSKLIQERSFDVTFRNEALTTRRAEAMLVEGGASRKKRQGREDSLAASLILQEFLDAL